MFTIYQSRILSLFGTIRSCIQTVCTRRVGVSILFTFLAVIVLSALYVMHFGVGSRLPKIANANSAYIQATIQGASVVVGISLFAIYVLLRLTCDKEGSLHARMWKRVRPVFLKEYDPFREVHGDVPRVPSRKTTRFTKE